MRLPLAGLQIARNGVVGVGGGDKALHRQPQRLGDEPRGEVAKVAGRHADDRLGPLGFRQLGHGFEVVADLGQQAADVDGVGGVEADGGLEPFIVEGILDQRLAGIEVTVDGEGADIAP